MSSLAKKIKSIVKQNPEPARGKFGVNPSDPWSAKANIAEDAMLDRFLKSRGINPKFVAKDTKISHAKSSEFLKWKQDHMVEDVDKKDSVSLDIPLMIRVLELAREDVKTDMELHRIVERLISIRNKGILTMDDYDFIADLKEEINWDGELAEAKTIQGTALDRFRQAAAQRAKEHEARMKDMERRHAAGEEPDVKGAIDRLEKSLKKEEVEQIDEISKSTLASYKDKSTASLKNAQANRDAAEAGKHMSKGFADLHAKSDAIVKKRINGLKGYLQRKTGMKPTSEDVYQDSQAATQTVFDGANNTDDTSNKKSQLSKSARMIKSLYKKFNMKEETYDWEKDDKGQTTSGKKPKLTKTEDSEHFGDNKPDARIVMTGGKTLTGEKRDTVEIDPMLKQRLSDNKKDESNKRND